MFSLVLNRVTRMEVWIYFQNNFVIKVEMKIISSSYNWTVKNSWAIIKHQQTFSEYNLPSITGED